MNWVWRRSLYFAWLIALIAVLGSLYYGEVLGFEPCRLCWYQRNAIFPLVLFLGIAFYNNDLKLARNCLPLIYFGALVAFYQSMIQILPALQVKALCGESAPCTLAGPAPFLSLAAFALIATLILKNKF